MSTFSVCPGKIVYALHYYDVCCAFVHVIENDSPMLWCTVTVVIKIQQGKSVNTYCLLCMFTWLVDVAADDLVRLSARFLPRLELYKLLSILVSVSTTLSYRCFRRVGAIIVPLQSSYRCNHRIVAIMNPWQAVTAFIAVVRCAMCCVYFISSLQSLADWSWPVQ